MRAWASVVGFLSFASCTPQGEATLQVTLTPKSVTDATPIRVKVTATKADGSTGTGTVRLASQVGAFSANEAVLDGFGVAQVEFVCDPAVEPLCRTATLTASWTSDGVEATGKATLTASSAATDGGTGSDAGSFSDFSAYGSGLRVVGSPTGFVWRGDTGVLAPGGNILAGFYSTNTGVGSDINLTVYPAGQATSWSLLFGVPPGQSFGVGHYPTTTRFTSADARTGPGLDISSSGGCNENYGSFDVLDFAVGADGGVGSLTITFEQFCENVSTDWIRGWVRFGH